MKQLAIFVLFLIVFCAFKKRDADKAFVHPVSSSKPSKMPADASVSSLAEAFKKTLSESQLASLQLPLTKANAVHWSNLPTGMVPRNGLELGSLSPEQLTAAKAVIAAAAGKAGNEGYDEFSQVGLADDILGQTPRGRGGYGNTKYFIAFLGSPSSTGTWMLQFGGHHYAQNITYSNSVAVSGTPSHQGVEPLTWTSEGKTYAPLAQEAGGMAEMLASMTIKELDSAKNPMRFSDLLVGANKDGRFPSVKSGIKVALLSKTAKAKVLAAMMPWLNDLDASMKAKLLTIYTKELDETYVTYSGNANGTSGNPGSFFTTNGDYVRIDGPSVWVELVCQNAVHLTGIHYHTIFRDHTRDYNGL